MTSKHHQGIKEYVQDPQALFQYMSTMNELKQEAESTIGTTFGPQGSNGHLTAAQCGKVGGMMTKSVFLSFADTSRRTVHAGQTQQATNKPQIFQ